MVLGKFRRTCPAGTPAGLTQPSVYSGLLGGRGIRGVTPRIFRPKEAIPDLVAGPTRDSLRTNRLSEGCDTMAVKKTL